MGNRPLLKAWQGMKKQPKPLCGFFFFVRAVTSPVRESGSFFSPPLTDKKTVQLFFVSSSIYSSNNISYSENIFQVYFSDLKKTAIQHNTKKVKKQKRKSGHKTCKKPTTIAPNLPTTHLFRIQI